MESQMHGAGSPVGARPRRLAALSYFSIPLAVVWGPLVVRAIGRESYVRQHAAAALTIQLALGVVWFPLNVLVIVGVLSSVGRIGFVILCLSILFSWGCGVRALKGHAAPAFTRRWAGSA